MDIAALAALAGNAVVTAVVTDAWNSVRDKIACWFGRGKPDPKALERLGRTHAELASAAPGELTRMQQDLAREWAGRFKDLIGDYPDAANELEDLVNDIRASTGTASDHAVTAGRDAKITASSSAVASGVIDGNVTTGPTRPGPGSS